MIGLQADMHPLPRDVRADANFHAFESAWQVELSARHGDASAARALVAVYWRKYAWSTLFKFLNDTLSMLSPQFMSQLILFMSQSQSLGVEPPPLWVGCAWAAAIFLSALLQAVLTQSAQDITTTLGIRVRASVVTKLFHKSLVLSVR